MNIPKYLPSKFRKCADEDGAIISYSIPVDKDSYLLGRAELLNEIESKFQRKTTVDFAFSEADVISYQISEGTLNKLKAETQSLREE
ncbi:hypothetical protein LCGC14_1703990 [marine sediment metagenome]|uniref:Uncharacterized protein n=1 Tax=marine sediment metagenome TaxID=412755 RepID=A0A0F9JXP0_9ZZZZ